jgi:hypothetical protein
MRGREKGDGRVRGNRSSMAVPRGTGAGDGELVCRQEREREKGEEGVPDLSRAVLPAKGTRERRGASDPSHSTELPVRGPTWLSMEGEGQH